MFCNCLLWHLICWCQLNSETPYINFSGTLTLWGEYFHFSKEGFHMMSYQAKVIMTTRLVSFPHTLVLENTTKCYRTFCLVHTIIPHYNWGTGIFAYTLWWSWSKILAYIVVYSIQTGNQGAEQNHVHLNVYHIVQTLYYIIGMPAKKSNTGT